MPLPVILLTALLAFAGIGLAEPVTIEAEDGRVHAQAGVTVVEQADASGGKALQVPTEGVPFWNNVIVSNPLTQSGRYRLTTRLKAANFATLGKGWRFDLIEGAIHRDYGVAYGHDLQGSADFQDFVLEFDQPTDGKSISAYMRWSGKEGTPELFLDSFTFERVGDLPPLAVTKLWPNKIRYSPKERGTVQLSLLNRGPDSQAVTLRLTSRHGLAEPRLLETRKLTLPPGEQQLEIPFRNERDLYGYELHAALVFDGKVVSERAEPICVSDNPWATAVAGNRDEEWKTYKPIWGHLFYSNGSTDRETHEGVRQARENYTTITEFFSWSPGECFGMAPKESVWLRANGGNIIRSKRDIQRQVSELRENGIACITYVAYQAMGEATLELIAKRPEWFAYSANTGDHTEFYQVNEWLKYQEFWKTLNADPMKLSTIGYFVPNYARRDVVDYCADQVIASARMFGWDGLRWDCGNLNPGPIWGDFVPQYDFYGKPLATNREEVEEKTVENLKRLRSRIHRAFPDFVIGTNFGSVEETRRMPRMVEELCRDGGWLLDEVSYMYGSLTSPYHWWKAYYAVMAEQGEYVTSIGGHYHPFALNRNGGKYPVDRLYSTIFMMVGKGHPNGLYYNSRTPFGNPSQYSVRFGQYLYASDLRRLESPHETITVNGSQPLWWDKSVQQRHSRSLDQTVIHLINPPVAAEIETDPTSKLPQPVRDISVTMTIPKGRDTVHAWALAAEAWRSGDSAKTQAVSLPVDLADGKATVTLPEILIYKAVVFDFEG